MLKPIIAGTSLLALSIIFSGAVHANEVADNEYHCVALTDSPQAPHGVEVAYEKIRASSAQGAEVKMARLYLQAGAVHCF